MADEKFTIDVSKWRMKQHKAWVEANRNADVDAMAQSMSQVVTAWPYGGDPGSVAAYDDLWPAEWAEVVAAVMQTANAAFRRAGG